MDSAGEIDIKHRFATAADFDSIFDLYMDSASNPYLTYDPMDKDEFKKIYEELIPSNTLYIAELDGKVAGTYRLIPKKDRQAHIIYLGGFAVSHSMKGKGIGSKILDHIAYISENEGRKRIELTVDVDNEPAINLYTKMGYAIEGRIRNSYRRNQENRYFDEYLMGKLL